MQESLPCSCHSGHPLLSPKSHHAVPRLVPGCMMYRWLTVNPLLPLSLGVLIMDLFGGLSICPLMTLAMTLIWNTPLLPLMMWVHLFIAVTLIWKTPLLLLMMRVHLFIPISHLSLCFHRHQTQFSLHLHCPYGSQPASLSLQHGSVLAIMSL